jgi:nicotinamide-nucleotide amidase
MGISVICTGTELLRGSTVNTNLAELGRELTSRGAKLDSAFTVGDRAEDLYGALADALKLSDCVVFIGGLGPTADDLTLPCAAHFFGLELHQDAELTAKVDEFWARLHQGRCPKNQYKQAMLPEGGRAIPNPNGSASGIEFSGIYDHRMRHVFLLPGPPTEFVPMVKNYLADRLLELSGAVEQVRGCLAAGVGESFASRLVEQALGGADPALAYTANFEGTRVYVCDADSAEAERKFGIIRTALGDAALPEGEFSLAPYLVKQLIKRDLTFSAAESCTGGLIASAVVDVPGASAAFMGGIVAYDNMVKHELLGVPAATLERFGAVSPETAEAMARGVAERLHTDCSVATTGIAGPGGGTAEKPVGLVYVSAFLNGRCEVREFRFRGGRDAIRHRAVAKALLLALEMLEKTEC